MSILIGADQHSAGAFLLWRGPYTEAAAHGKEAPLLFLKESLSLLS